MGPCSMPCIRPVARYALRLAGRWPLLRDEAAASMAGGWLALQSARSRTQGIEGISTHCSRWHAENEIYL
jgi:hypothetical protein